ncbi:hypothetical protein ABZ234_03990 [Nocardiopsis sp. NPDC006198]|uniref:hypothetical protein n=1 Tax=Nocardiopsis sp. NPDC006198 TaxID=3154472 RepID=UPI0033AACCEE
MTPEQKITRPERYRDAGGDIWETVPGTFGDDLVDESGCIRSYDHVLSQYGPLTLVHDDETSDPAATPEPPMAEFYADIQDETTPAVYETPEELAEEIERLRAELARSYSQGVEDMREAAMRAASDAPGTPYTPTEAIRDLTLTNRPDLHGDEEVFPGSIAAAEAALDGVPAVSARWTKSVVVEEDGAWVLCTTTDGRDVALRLPCGEHTELAEALLEETVDVAELRASCAAAEADYRRVVRWHQAMAVAIVQLGGDLPEGAPGMPEMVSDLVKIHGADKIRAALDSL